jgi:hypothetical protein
MTVTYELFNIICVKALVIAEIATVAAARGKRGATARHGRTMNRMARSGSGIGPPIPDRREREWPGTIKRC